MQHGHVRLSSVGMVRLRGKARTPGEAKTAEVMHKSGKWYLSVTVECVPQREAGAATVGLDWGLETFATAVDSAGQNDPVKNPRFLDKAQRLKLKQLQQAASRKTTSAVAIAGAPSQSWQKNMPESQTVGATSCISKAPSWLPVVR
jgi:putative transposase